MSRISCNVNKDLLPLYVDDVCSEESKDLVEEHLSECGECQNYYEALKEENAREEEALCQEREMQKALLAIKKKYGKNAVLKGMSLEEGATARERNNQIGGHKA